MQLSPLAELSSLSVQSKGRITNVEFKAAKSNAVPFSSMLKPGINVGGKIFDADQGMTAEKKSKLEQTKVTKAFETMLVSQFLKPMFADYTKSMFGKGVQSEVYTSLFTEAVAKSVTERGGFGFGKLV